MSNNRLSPESLRYLTFSTETDVWSCGVLLWEMFSLGAEPFSEFEYNYQFKVELEQGLRLENPSYANTEM